MTIIAYEFCGNSSNDAEFFDGSEPSDTLCPVCQCCLDEQYVPKFLDVSKSKKYDVAYTHDLKTVFSERFVRFCLDVLKTDEEFIPIKTPHAVLYYMLPKRVLQYNPLEKMVRFEALCLTCNQFAVIVKPGPVLLKDETPINTGFYRTDLSFSDGKNKHPLLIVGTEWKELLAQQKFRGLTFEPIREKDAVLKKLARMAEK